LEAVIEQRRLKQAEEEEARLVTLRGTSPVEDLKRVLDEVSGRPRLVKRTIVASPMGPEEYIDAPNKSSLSRDIAIDWLKKQEFYARKLRTFEKDRTSFMMTPSLAIKTLSIELCKAIDEGNDSRNLEGNAPNIMRDHGIQHETERNLTFMLL
jgi:hypothetical protein